MADFFSSFTLNLFSFSNIYFTKGQKKIFLNHVFNFIVCFNVFIFQMKIQKQLTLPLIYFN